MLFRSLLIRASALAKELTLAKLELGNYAIFTQKIKSKLNKLSETDNPEIKEILHALNDWIQAELPKTSKSNTLLHQLLTQNKKSRPITTHVQILPSGHECLLEGNITLLEAGLNAGLALNYGCSNGNCGNCKAKLISGQIKKSRPSDYCFSETEKTQNYILMCTTTALTDVIIEADEANKIQDIPLQNIIAKVKKLDSANDTVSILNLKTPRTKRLRFLAGQQVKLSINDALSKVLSIASCPCDDMNIQFHITSQDNNPFSKYILEQLKFGDEVTIEGPQGEFILSDDASNTVILIAMDTGFAPIKSLAEHTMTLAHAENVHIHWLTSEKQEHYMRHQCRAWADAFDSFQYFEAGLQHNLNTDKGKEELNTQLSKIIGAYPNIDSCHIYLAGNKHFIEISKIGRAHV